MGSKQNPLASIEEGRIGSWRNMNKTRGLQNIYVSTRNIYTVEKIKNQSDATVGIYPKSDKGFGFMLHQK